VRDALRDLVDRHIQPEDTEAAGVRDGRGELVRRRDAETDAEDRGLDPEHGAERCFEGHRARV
jgi:hypothetical protein